MNESRRREAMAPGRPGRPAEDGCPAGNRMSYSTPRLVVLGDVKHLTLGVSQAKNKNRADGGNPFTHA